MVKIDYPIEGPHPTGYEGWVAWALELRERIQKLIEAGQDLEKVASAEDLEDWKKVVAWRFQVGLALKVLNEIGEK